MGKDTQGQVEVFEPLKEEPTQGSAEWNKSRKQAGRSDIVLVEEEHPEHAIGDVGSGLATQARTDHDRIASPAIYEPPSEATEKQSLQSSHSDVPPKVPWTTSTWVALKGFWKWFITPFGFFVTIYGLNVVAWGGMLFLLLCNASPYMCWAPVHTKENQKHMSDVAALNLPGPYYYNCNDINSPRRVWLEIDSQILNALFCVTGFGLAPWRFRDLYYLLRWRFTSSKKGPESKLYGLRVLAGIHRGWFRLPDSDTLDKTPTKEYLATQGNHFNHSPEIDVEANTSSGFYDDPQHDLRIPLPLSKRPDDPPKGVRAPATVPWKLDFFIWCMVWNTFFQCVLCGFMWGLDRYARPSWSTGLFVALGCIIAGVGGIMSYIEGKRIKKIEGVPPKPDQNVDEKGHELKEVTTGGTGHESVLLADSKRMLRGGRE